MFDNIYRKLERELHEKKRQMANIIELSNLSYEQRDNYQMEIAAIEQQNRKEQEDFEEQMMELGRMLENELKISAPTAGASGRLSPLKRNASSRTGVGATGGAPEMSGNMTSAEEAALTGKVNKGAWGIAKDKAEVHVSQERVQNFEEVRDCTAAAAAAATTILVPVLLSTAAGSCCAAIMSAAALLLLLLNSDLRTPRLRRPSTKSARPRASPTWTSWCTRSSRTRTRTSRSSTT